MRAGCRAFAVISVCLGTVAGSSAQARDPAEPPYRIQPSEVAVPEGVEMGQYQRVVRPFENWTLICDENLATREKVCNVTQTINDRNGTMVFSWSLAATRDGDPYMILRTAPGVGREGTVSLDFESRDKPVDVRIEGCNRHVCVGMAPVGPILREQIAAQTSPRISYRTADGSAFEVTTRLEGLSRALEAID